MLHKKETRPESLQAKGRAAKSKEIVSDPFANFTWAHGAVFMAAWVFMLAFITFSEIGVIS